jgi:hypothetical protein
MPLFGAAPGTSFVTAEPIMGFVEIMGFLKRMVNQSANRKVAQWSDEGGPASIEYYSCGGAGVLIVTQTREGQAQVAALLDVLRSASEVGGSMLTIHVTWLEVTDAKAADLLGRDPAKRQVPMEVTPADLAKADAKTLYRAATTCFDRQEVCAASGNLRTYVGSTTPIVCEGLFGWTSNVRPFMVGGVLEVRPHLAADRSTVLLDYRSYLTTAASIEHCPVQVATDAKDNAKAATTAPTTIDLPSLECQTLRGSVRIPLGKTILLGCTTGPKLKDGKVACLVVEVSASKAEAAPPQAIPLDTTDATKATPASSERRPPTPPPVPAKTGRGKN